MRRNWWRAMARIRPEVKVPRTSEGDRILGDRRLRERAYSQLRDRRMS